MTASRAITSPLVRNYFDNLLPDNPQIRERIRNRYHVRSAESFYLLEEIGRDCVGAVLGFGTPVEDDIHLFIVYMYGRQCSQVGPMLVFRDAP